MTTNNDKSYVTLEQHICVVCGRAFDTGSLLLDRRVRDVFDTHTVTGWGMCPEDRQKRDDGYIALIGCRNEATKPGDCDRTGDIIHIRATVFPRIFDVPVPEQGVAFVDPDIIAYLKRLAEESD